MTGEQPATLGFSQLTKDPHPGHTFSSLHFGLCYIVVLKVCSLGQPAACWEEIYVSHWRRGSGKVCEQASYCLEVGFTSLSCQGNNIGRKLMLDLCSGTRLIRIVFCPRVLAVSLEAAFGPNQRWVFRACTALRATRVTMHLLQFADPCAPCDFKPGRI